MTKASTATHEIAADSAYRCDDGAQTPAVTQAREKGEGTRENAISV